MNAAIKAIGYVNRAIGECWQERDYRAMLAGVLLWPYFVLQQAHYYRLWKARGEQ